MDQVDRTGGGTRSNTRARESQFSEVRLQPLNSGTSPSVFNTLDAPAPHDVSSLDRPQQYPGVSAGLNRPSRQNKRAPAEILESDRRHAAARVASEQSFAGIDAIPFQTSSRQPKHQNDVRSSGLDTNNTSFLSRTTSSARTSFTSVFSAPNGSQTTLSSQDVDNDPPSASLESLDLQRPELPRPASSIKPSPIPLQERLKGIWPVFPSPYLNEAPLPIIWEITRAATSLGVSLSHFDLRYSPEGGWDDQTKLRAALATNPLFVGKGLPPECDSQVWAAGLQGFKKGNKVVVLTAELSYSSKSDGPLYDLKLGYPELRLGHRLDRRFGSDRILEVTIPSPTSNEMPKGMAGTNKEFSAAVLKWLCGTTHYFLGRTWTAFFTRSVKKKVKEATDLDVTRDVFVEQVYFFAIDGNQFRPPYPLGTLPPQEQAEKEQSRTKLNLAGLYEWVFGGTSRGKKCSLNQPTPKLFSRIALSLSRTVPTVVLEPDQIIEKPDVVNHAGEVMNDGIGQLSRSLARKIANMLGLSSVPCGYQARLGSAKGMWIVTVDDNEVEGKDWIEIYPSQCKWECDFHDVQHRTFEVKSWPRPLISSSLNQQFIPILLGQALNKPAMRETIARHLRNVLEEELVPARRALLDPLELLLWVEKYAKGMDVQNLGIDRTTFVGSIPDHDEDMIVYLLRAGFEPQSCKLLKEKAGDIVRKRIQLLKKKMNIAVPCSTTALMVTDFRKVLKPDEVHISFSSNFNAEGFSDTLLEDRYILVARSPAHYPSDIWKVKVVSLPHLRHLKDVIVFPTTGPRPLADCLSGGDYDGDRAWICWDPEIVNNFGNAQLPIKFDFVAEGFLRKSDSLSLGSFVQKYGSNAYPYFRNNGFMFNMQQSLLGRCTKYKERMCYHDNDCVDSDQAIALSALLSDLVDQAKAGLEFINEDWDRFLNERLRSPKRLESPLYERESAPDGWDRSDPNVRIMDYLKFSVAEPMVEDALKIIKTTMEADGDGKFDEHLTRLANIWDLKADEGCSISKALRTKLKRDIEAIREGWRDTFSPSNTNPFNYKASVNGMYQKWLLIAPDDKIQMEPGVLRLKDSWLLSPEDRDLGISEGWDAQFSLWALLKASWTCKMYCNESNGYKFIWRMAGKQLAEIKAKIISSSPEYRNTGPSFCTPAQAYLLRTDKKLTGNLISSRAGGDDCQSRSDLDEVTEVDDFGFDIDDA